jgi:hypothetical protein
MLLLMLLVVNVAYFAVFDVVVAAAAIVDVFVDDYIAVTAVAVVVS